MAQGGTYQADVHTAEIRQVVSKLQASYRQVTGKLTL
nr:MAG TPA: hypothetical protein [Caudoviricetes sp.]